MDFDTAAYSIHVLAPAARRQHVDFDTAAYSIHVLASAARRQLAWQSQKFDFSEKSNFFTLDAS